MSEREAAADRALEIGIARGFIPCNEPKPHAAAGGSQERIGVGGGGTHVECDGSVRGLGAPRRKIELERQRPMLAWHPIEAKRSGKNISSGVAETGALRRFCRRVVGEGQIESEAH